MFMKEKKEKLKQYLEIIANCKLGECKFKTGEITDRYFGVPGEERTICPWIGGVRGWGVGSYNPKTQTCGTLWHKITAI